MPTRRSFFQQGAFGAAMLATLPQSTAAAGCRPTPEAEALHESIARMPVDDGHCHPISDKDTTTTPDDFISRLAPRWQRASAVSSSAWRRRAVSSRRNGRRSWRRLPLAAWT